MYKEFASTRSSSLGRGTSTQDVKGYKEVNSRWRRRRATPKRGWAYCRISITVTPHCYARNLNHAEGDVIIVVCAPVGHLADAAETCDGCDASFSVSRTIHMTAETPLCPPRALIRSLGVFVWMNLTPSRDKIQRYDPYPARVISQGMRPFDHGHGFPHQQTIDCDTVF